MLTLLILAHAHEVGHCSQTSTLLSSKQCLVRVWRFHTSIIADFDASCHTLTVLALIPHIACPMLYVSVIRFFLMLSINSRLLENRYSLEAILLSQGVMSHAY